MSAVPFDLIPRPAQPPPLLTPLPEPRLLAGAPLDWDAESFADHHQRLGRRPRGGPWMLDVVDRSGLRGRGGAWFPTGGKWRGVADVAQERSAVVVVNASEGEPLSAKDHTLLVHRPHLVIEGALIAAESVGAEEVVIYLARQARQTAGVIRRALMERRQAGLRELPMRVVSTAERYVAGESSAVVHRINGFAAKPSFSPPHPSERGVRDRPTLVQNAETVANVALIARYGDAWFRERGSPGAPGTVLTTLSGNVAFPGVYEVDLGTSLADVLNCAGGTPSVLVGALVGGYFGSWLGDDRLATTHLDPDAVTLGCGIVGLLGEPTCGLAEAGRIITYLAAESAGQCGPCVHGLGAIAETWGRIVASDADRGDIARVERWCAMIAGRGACRHPDGAVHNVLTALEAFPSDLARHLSGRPCPGRRRASLPPPPRARRRWR